MYSVYYIVLVVYDFDFHVYANLIYTLIYMSIYRITITLIITLYLINTLIHIYDALIFRTF